MAITGNSSYIPTMNEFAGHFTLVNAALAPGALLIGMPDNTTMSRAQFVALRDGLQAQQTVVQSKLNDQQIARAQIDLEKDLLLLKLNHFNGLLEAYYQSSKYFAARAFAPGIKDGQIAFTRPLIDTMTLWEKVNAGAAPAGVTLPLVLPDGTTQGTFASAVSSLQFSYQVEADCAQNVALARSDREKLQDRAYTAMKSYRLAVPAKLTQFPTLVATLPRLSPVGGHTPEAVDASALFQAPNASKVVYSASADADLKEYQLRGTVGDEYSEDDAIVIATNLPGAEREFLTTFGLTQAGAKIALKVYVVLTTGNESGSATMVVQRPALQNALVA